MLVYMAYDMKSGQVVHLHRTVDAGGRSTRSTDEEVLRALPPGLDPKGVGIVVTEMDSVPSGRDVVFSVDVTRGALVSTPAAATVKAATARKSAADRRPG